ncbi:hypothetical protein HPG69_006518 [Diceros bicornis minor]|uniref:Uncharacterized protein n=1 Tax=Diceros bicornis minor TaxID=77932 RepID=A0A7J7F5M4_DICBM|nr:hypothetical protein HPG69_006518 [Diceros bicornis minor]
MAYLHLQGISLITTQMVAVHDGWIPTKVNYICREHLQNAGGAINIVVKYLCIHGELKQQAF